MTGLNIVHNIGICGRLNQRWTFAQNQKSTYQSVLHSHTVLMK